MGKLMKMKLINDRIFLDGTEIKGLKSYEVKASAEELSILNMTLYVDTSGDKEEQDVSNRDINEIAFRISSNILKQLNESKSGGTRPKSRQKEESLVNKGVLKRVNQLVADEIKTEALNLKDIENSINEDAPRAIASEALKIYAMTNDERIALAALELILKAV